MNETDAVMSGEIYVDVYHCWFFSVVYCVFQSENWLILPLSDKLYLANYIYNLCVRFMMLFSFLKVFLFMFALKNAY